MFRILHVIDSLDLGGAQTALLNLLRHSDRSRFHHEVASMHGRGMFAGAFEADGVPVHQLSAGRWPPGYLVALPRLLERGRFDAGHFHLFGSNWIAKPVAAACGLRVLYNHDQCNDAFRVRTPVHALADALTNRLTTRAFAVSRSVARALEEISCLPRERITVLPNSVDTDEFRPASADLRARAKRELGFGAETFVVGAVGRHTRQKNFALLLEAFGRVSRARPEMAVVFFGDGPESGRLKELAAGFGGRVVFAGTRADRASVYLPLDAFALPSDFEGTPVALLEAMACGVPCAATAVDGTCEIATDGETALLVAPGDAAGLAGALGRLAAEPEFARRLAGRALERVRSNYSAKVLAATLDAIYASDLGRGGGSG